jgi:xylulokinase
MDARRRSAAEITTSVGGEERLRDLASNPALEGFTLPKVLWLRRHEPAAFARLAKVLLPKDYIRYRLTGALATEPSDASATLMYDTAHMRWSDEIMRAVELPTSLLPEVGASAEVLGRVTADAAQLTGMDEGTPSSAGARTTRAVPPASVSSRRRGGDELGNVGHRTGADRDAAGGSTAPRPHLLPRRARHVVSDGRRAHGGRGVHLVSGAARPRARGIERRRGATGRRSRLGAARRGGRDLSSISAGRADAAPRRRGSRRVLGLSLAHTRAHLTRAVLEGICFALRDSLTILQSVG